MKKLLLILTAISITSCNVDESFDKSVSQEVNMTLILPTETARASSAFDTSYNGVYRGVLTTDDISLHGVVHINAGNDGNYNALLVSTDGSKMGFVLDPKRKADKQVNLFTYINSTSKFTLDLRDINNPVISDVKINGLNGQAQVFKENSSSKIQVTTGNYTDDTNASNTGLWDIVSTSSAFITLPSGQPFPFDTVEVLQNFITSIVVMRNGGNMFTDTTMETFTPSVACVAANPVLPSGPQVPFFVEGQIFVGGIIPVDVDEVIAYGQTSNYGGTVTWDFAYSLANGETYLDANCNPTLNGTWTGANSSGKIFIN